MGSNKSHQFLLLLWKNYTLQKRKKILSVLEIGLPTLFVLVLLVMRQGVTPTRADHPTHWTAFSVESFPPDLIPYSAARDPGSVATWQLCYTPDVPAVRRIMSQVASKLNLSIDGLGFSTEDALVDHLAIENSTTSDVMGGVVFTSEFANNTEELPTHVSYKIRMKAEQYFGINQRVRFKTASDWLTGYVFPLASTITPRELNETEGGAPGYYREGFLAIQRAVDVAILSERNHQASWEDISINLKRHPFPPYVDDPFIQVIQSQLPVVILLSFLITAPNICKDIVLEKERKLKEFMRMMGLCNWQHWLAWFVKYAIFCLISVLIMTLLLFLDFGRGGIFNYSDPSLIFVFLFLYCVSTIMFCFMVAAFFSKASSGAAAGAILFIATYLPYFFLANRYAQFSLGAKLGSCSMHNVAMAFGCYLIGIYEGRGFGIRWDNFHQPINVSDDFTMLHVFLMMSVDCLIYGVIAWYVDAVRPGEYGRPQPLYFPFTRAYWCGMTRDESLRLIVEEDMRSLDHGKKAEFFEASPKDLKAGIAIRHLRKVFKRNGKKKVAVSDLNLDMYEGQITSLLGHNGAGKTTTMFMLTGFLVPSDGTAYVNGYDVRRELDGVRDSLGLCPQHDVLFDNMTVEEHLYFFGRLKGIEKKNIEKEVVRMIQILHLEDKTNEKVQNLSGGMKRKVSVGIALIGGSKVVVLDEPSSGMDPEARRQLWDILQQQKEGRTMVLSTHFMDEADFLGDRIAIMAEGEARCCGTSLFLKDKYGVGYHMVIVKEPSCDVTKVTNVVTSHVPEATMESNVSAELSYILPKESCHKFEELFSQLEKDKEQLGISSFGASVTTMEEVFLKVGETVDEETMNDDLRKMSNGHGLDNTTFAEEDASRAANSGCHGNQSVAVTVVAERKQRQMREPTIYFEKNVGWQCLVQQFRALLEKRIIHSWRNRILAVGQFLLPLFFAVVGCLIVNSFPGPTDPPPMDLTLAQFHDPVVPYSTNATEEEDLPHKLSDTYASLMREGVSYVPYLNELEDYADNPDMEQYLLDAAGSDFTRYVNDYMTGAVFSSGDQENASILAYFNNEAYHSPGVTLTYISNTLLRHFLGEGASVHVTNHPLPRQTTAKSGEEVATSGVVAMILGHNISFGLCFLVGSFVVFIIKEKTTKSKHLQYVSGVRVGTYWASTFFWDIVNFMIPSLCIVAIFAIFDIKPYYEGDQAGYMILSLVFFGCAVLPFVYCLSQAFTVPSSGYVWVTVLNIILATVAMLTVEILQYPGFGAEHVSDGLRWAFMFFIPNYAFLVAAQNIYYNYESLRACGSLEKEVPHDTLEEFCSYLAGFNQTNVCCKNNCEPECIDYHDNYLAWSLPGIGRPLFCMGIQFLMYFALLFFIDSGWINYARTLLPRKRKTISEKCPEEAGSDVITDQEAEDNDVKAERERIGNTPIANLTESDSLVVSELQKSYGSLQAVNKLSLGVPQGECFGLLGVNGAGKTTTFKMLTGDEVISGGNAWLQGYSVTGQIKQAQQRMGYCPQFDALIDQMTVKETLVMYGRLRGVRESFLPEVVEQLISSLLLEPYTDKQAGDLSGGNKRKLSTAIALIGDPPIVFLDEPTTGMDPVARRLLWDTLTKVRATGRTLVLTSHSMEECEALCTRLAIMVNGQFKCLGSTQYLKSKFGEGYTLMAKVKTNMEDDKTVESNTKRLMTFIEDTFQNSILKDLHHGYVHYQIANDQHTWAEIFGIVERAKDKYNIEDYSVSQTTLEQVFINFARAQKSRELTEVNTRTKCSLCCAHFFRCSCCCGESRKTSNTTVVSPSTKSNLSQVSYL